MLPTVFAQDIMTYCLIYKSSAVGSPGQGDLEKVLLEARTRNKRDNITGLLLFHDGHYLQVLEGQKDKVLACYDRIRADNRHRRFSVVRSEPIEKRNFADWDMAYMPFSLLSAAHQKSFIDLGNLSTSEKTQELIQDEYNRALVEVFLSSFSNLNFG
jgi:hypothetical protein